MLLCVDGGGEKPNSQGHSSSASSCHVSAPPMLTCGELTTLTMEIFIFEIQMEGCMILRLKIKLGLTCSQEADLVFSVDVSTNTTMSHI